MPGDGPGASLPEPETLRQQSLHQRNDKAHAAGIHNQGQPPQVLDCPAWRNQAATDSQSADDEWNHRVASGVFVCSQASDGQHDCDPLRDSAEQGNNQQAR